MIWQSTYCFVCMYMYTEYMIILLYVASLQSKNLNKSAFNSHLLIINNRFNTVGTIIYIGK